MIAACKVDKKYYGLYTRDKIKIPSGYYNIIKCKKQVSLKIKKYQDEIYFTIKYRQLSRTRQQLLGPIKHDLLLLLVLSVRNVFALISANRSSKLIFGIQGPYWS